jgi:glycosyltransferase involved in cell wall biosynthesis
MRILFVLDYSFPNPSAPSNRIASLVKALEMSLNKVSVLCIRGTYIKKDEAFCKKKNHIIYSCKRERNQNYFLRNLVKIIGFFNSFLIIISEDRKEKIDVVFLPVKLNIYNSFVYVLSRLLNFKIAHERSEFPEIYKKDIISSISYYYYTKYFVKKLDGIIVMTDTLNEYFTRISSKRIKVKTIPMSVDFDRFKYDKKEQKQQYLAYCGNVSNKKDGVDILIKAFAKISSKFPDLKLYIIGGSSDKNLLNELEEICKVLNIKEKVVFTGKVSADDMPSYLINASVLALARPSSLQASGGFPTKLGEYLATKNPVVVTDVGEISSYLKDGESAYISAPDSVEQFASKLDECLSNFERSKKIGEKGYEVAQKYFDYRSQSDALTQFLYELVKK